MIVTAKLLKFDFVGLCEYDLVYHYDFLLRIEAEKVERTVATVENFVNYVKVQVKRAVVLVVTDKLK